MSNEFDFIPEDEEPEFDFVVDEPDEPMPEGSPPPRAQRSLGDVVKEEATDPLRLAGRIGGALYGPAAQSAMGGVQALKDLLTPGVSSGIGEEARAGLEALKGAFSGVPRGVASTAKTFMPVPLVPADVIAEGPAAYGNELRQFGATASNALEGLAKTLTRGGVDPDRPVGSSGDIGALGAALGRVVGQSPTPKPSEFRGKLRDKARMLKAEDNIEKLRATAEELKKRSRDARKASPVNKQLEDARSVERQAEDALARAQRELAPKDVLKPLRQDYKAAKDARKGWQVERKRYPGVRENYRRAKEIERNDIPDQRAVVKRIGADINDTWKGRLVDWLSTKKTFPGASVEIPGVSLGSPEALMAVEGALRRASQSSQYIKSALGPALAAGSIEDALAVHDELMQSDNLYRQNFELFAAE